jgi:hypothetical protein
MDFLNQNKMKVENIPVTLTIIFPAHDGGRTYNLSAREFTQEHPLGEDRTADSIMMDAWLSFTLPN